MVHKIKFKHVDFPLFFFFEDFYSILLLLTIRRIKQTNREKKSFIKILSYIVLLFFIVYLSLVEFR